MYVLLLLDAMKNKFLLDRYLLAKPSTRMYIEWPILIGVGFAGTVFSLPTMPFYPATNILGFILLAIGLVIHGLSHKVHKQAHEQARSIEKIVTIGIYCKIRHPCYLGLILTFFGFAFAWSIVWIFTPVVILSILYYLTAIKEEEYLKEKFGKEYEDYMRQVPRRFIPKLF